MKISKRRSREMVLIDILTAGEFVYLRCMISRHSTRPFNFQTSFFLFFTKLLCSRHCHNVDFFSINRGLTFAILKFYYSLWKSTKKQEKNNCMIFYFVFEAVLKKNIQIWMKRTGSNRSKPRKSVNEVNIFPDMEQKSFTIFCKGEIFFTTSSSTHKSVQSSQ